MIQALVHKKKSKKSLLSIATTRQKLGANRVLMGGQNQIRHLQYQKSFGTACVVLWRSIKSRNKKRAEWDPALSLIQKNID